MITLSTNKGLLRIKSWSEIEERPGFVQDLDPLAEKLDSIIGRYVEKEKVRCGLSNCHTPHNKGYLVVTKNGQETNIGKDCGKTYFGVDFEVMSKKFDRDLQESENREYLWSFSFVLEELENTIAQWKEQTNSASWMNAKVNELITIGRGVPDSLVNRFKEMVRSRQGTLFLDREATEQEIEAIEVAENRKISRPYYVQERIAEIAGFRALFPENNLRELIVLELEKPLAEFKHLDIDSLSSAELNHWTRWAGTIPSTIEKVKDSMTEAIALLKKNNLKPFLQVLERESERKNFDRFLSGLEC